MAKTKKSSLRPSELRTILPSQRANIYLLEHCRLLVNGGRVEYVTQQQRQELYWNIPIANTSCILLGNGTSLTQAAARELAKAGVMVGFCGGDGTPLFSASDGYDQEILWFNPQSEYRPTEYLHAWLKFWPQAEQRLRAAKIFQHQRLEYLDSCWRHNRLLAAQDFCAPAGLSSLLQSSAAEIERATSTTELLSVEAHLTKRLYQLVAQTTNYGAFSRDHRREADGANRFLNHGNYLAYGLAATAIWTLGLPAALAVIHGKTRRGALVFDVADLVKDALILPQAFLAAIRGDEQNEFRQHCIALLFDAKALARMFAVLKQTISTISTPEAQ